MLEKVQVFTSGMVYSVGGEARKCTDGKKWEAWR